MTPFIKRSFICVTLLTALSAIMQNGTYGGTPGETTPPQGSVDTGAPVGRILSGSGGPLPERAHATNFPLVQNIWPADNLPGQIGAPDFLPRLTYYLPSPEYRTGQSVLILPGGGYRNVSTAKEGHRPAQLLASKGIAAAVLEYRHAPQRFPVPLLDAQRALRIVRQYAIDHGLDPEAVGVMGFSAGGHLAGLLSHLPVQPEASIGDALDQINPQPNFTALIYPVVSLVADYAHRGSRNNLLGPNSSESTAAGLSLENLVQLSTPPHFIAQLQDDSVTPSAGALALYATLTKSNIPASLHIYPGSQHGTGLGHNHPWGKALLEWLAAMR